MFPQAAPVGSEGDASRRRFRRSDSESSGSSGSSESDFRRFWLPTFEKKLTRLVPLVPSFFSTSRLLDFSTFRRAKRPGQKLRGSPVPRSMCPIMPFVGHSWHCHSGRGALDRGLPNPPPRRTQNGHRAGWASGLSKGLAEMKHRPGPEDCCSLRVITLIAPVLLVS